MINAFVVFAVFGSGMVVGMATASIMFALGQMKVHECVSRRK